MSGVNGEAAAIEWAAQGAEDEAERCAKFLARFAVKQDISQPEAEDSVQ